MFPKSRDQEVVELYNRKASSIKEGKFVSLKLTMLSSNDYNPDLFYFITETVCKVGSNPGIKIVDTKGRQLSNVIRVVKSSAKTYPTKIIIAHHIFESMAQEIGLDTKIS